MKTLSKYSRVLLAVAALLLAERPALAEPPAQQENRFLIIVDTASAMRRYSNSIVQVVVDLMDTDMRGEFRTGDTVGLWTYNDKLHTDFPMQVWSKTNRSTITADMGVYLQEQRFEKQGHLDRVLPTLGEVIRSSERLTVIFVFDGNGRIQGTRFDTDINALQKKYAHELRSAHVPFVTVLAARDGSVFDYTINYPGLISIPHTANPELPPTNAVAAVTPPVAPPAKPRPTSSLVLSGNKETHVEIAAPQSGPPASAPPIADSHPEVQSTPVPVIINTPPPTVAATIPTPAPQPAPVTAAVAQTPPPVITPAPMPAPQPVATITTPPAQPQPAAPPVAARQYSEPPKETAYSPAPAPVAPVAPPAAPAPSTASSVTPETSVVLPGGGQMMLFGVAILSLTVAILLAGFPPPLPHAPSQPHQPIA